MHIISLMVCALQAALGEQKPSSDGKMKVSAAGLALLLIVAAFSQTFSGPAGLNIPICCFTYRQHKLPWKLIQRHYITSSSCPQPAIV
ncbi:hypothetical protein DV515_00011255 [Chloebia gouldiae]|uniref:Chemokine interleukin-8-like domain-containing protein n=1 Tax=Chloebia gouldiae TaxID=44316 RepID=A0A3L8S7Z9_CHLGU|nr:hypothetical protein DV515_00011316 [Chloebia gouldiae]RLV97955.1 hypothetical protein DV515_00011255 [Chloebia gouldiae]